MSDALTPVADGGEKSRSVGFAPETLAEATVGTAASGETAGRVRRSPGRVLRHEATLACVAGLLLAVAMIWLVPPFAIWVMSAGETSPVIPDPRRTITGNVGDPTAQAWILAWNGHAVLHDISHVWRTNAFYREKYPRPRCVVGLADVLNPRRVRGQIAWASSVNAAATRVAGGVSTASS
jgi:hypothetical protein